MSKIFKTYEEQIAFLKAKGLTISDEAFAEAKLKDISYFALINGYKSIFKKADRTYIENASFEDIVNLFLFDEELRSLILKYILKIERKLKSFISYYFSQKYPNHYDYLDVNNYNYQIVKNRETIHKLILKLSTTAKSKNSEYLKHYNDVHSGQVPLWVLVNALSFGKVSKFYSISKQNIQQKISDEFGGVSNAELENMLFILALFRNVCAHNERLFDFKATSCSLKNNSYLNQLSVPLQGSNYSVGGNDLFSVVICFKTLLAKEDFKHFFQQLENLVDKISPFSSNISKSDILYHMHFPPNWKDVYKI